MWNHLEQGKEGHRRGWNISGAVKMKGAALSTAQWDESRSFLAAGIF